MENDDQSKTSQFEQSVIDQLKAELNELDNELVNVEGNRLKASQCYHFDVSPLHVLFNTNCPDTLREKVNAILSKYISTDEDSTQEQRTPGQYG